MGSRHQCRWYRKRFDFLAVFFQANYWSGRSIRRHFVGCGKVLNTRSAQNLVVVEVAMPTRFASLIASLIIYSVVGYLDRIVKFGNL